MDWVTALLGAGGAIAGVLGAITGVYSLVLQRRQDAALERERRREEARTVTAQWVTRELDRPNSLGRVTEWGLWVRNHGRVPVHDVRIEAAAKDVPCTLPIVDPLQSGEMFIRKNSASSTDDFDVRRMGANVTSTDPIYTPTWRVTKISFVLEGQPVTWAAHSR